jgi:hemolysin activation/secretion protein
MLGRLNVRFLGGAAALALTLPALGQDINRGIQVTPDEDLVEQLAPEANIDRTPVLPPAPPRPTDRRLRGLLTIRLDGVQIENGSMLTAAEVESVAGSFTGRDVSMEELEELRRRLSLLYFDKGYVNSGLVLPDQEIRDNVVRYREIRGELTAIQLSGNDNLRDTYITKRIVQPGDGPLEINALQRSLQLLERDPMISRINAQLLPGAMPGQGMLRLEVTESRPWQFIVRADNHRSPAVGGNQVSLMARNRSLTGRGDEFTVYGSYADGYGDGFASYALPLNAFGSVIRIYGSRSDSDIVEAPFDDIDIQSRTETYGLAINQRLHQSLAGSLSAYAGLELKHNENTLLGQPFSFTYGERDGVTDLTVLYAGVELAQRFERSVLAVRGGFRIGLHSAGATENRIEFGQPSIGPDGKFVSLILQGQFIQNLDWRDSSLFARLTFQHASDPLLSMEKLPVGGASTVRGYRENTLVRDNGLIASLEYQVPLFKPDARKEKFEASRVTLSMFADYGLSWNEGWEFEPNTSKQEIPSIGLGFLWNPSSSLSASLYWGYALDDFDTGSGDLQDDGVHFSISWTPWD